MPPYGRTLADRLSKPITWRQYAGTSPDGSAVTVWVGIGPNAWYWARERVDSFLLTILPPDTDPSALDWRVCAGHDPVVVQRCGDVQEGEVHALADALLRDGVQRVLDAETGNIHVLEAAA
jgi:hypothetical protein